MISRADSCLASQADQGDDIYLMAVRSIPECVSSLIVEASKQDNPGQQTG